MPSNRGAHPEDAEQFGPSQWPRLRAAVRDLSWLCTRGYGRSSARELVGNRYRLKRRQRNAVGRSACSDSARARRLQTRVQPREAAGQRVDIDAFNVLITIEAALGGAYLFVGRDTAYRDVNPLKGTYRVVRQTDPAISLLADTLQALAPKNTVWHLDQSVSNVGRVKAKLEDRTASWTVVVRDNVDDVLCESESLVVTSDSAVLDAGGSWIPLGALVHARHIPDANLVDLRPDGERSKILRSTRPK